MSRILKECRVPLCTNIQDVFKKHPFCSDCMKNTLDRFVFCDSDKSPGRRAFWEKYIVDNADSLVKAEEEVIARRGADYDRDSLY